MIVANSYLSFNHLACITIAARSVRRRVAIVESRNPGLLGASALALLDCRRARGNLIGFGMQDSNTLQPDMRVSEN